MVAERGETDTGFIERGNFEEAAYEGLLNGDRIVIPGLENNSTPSSGAYSPGSST